MRCCKFSKLTIDLSLIREPSGPPVLIRLGLEFRIPRPLCCLFSYILSHHSIVSLLMPLLHLLNLGFTEQELHIEAAGCLQLSSSSASFELLIEPFKPIEEVVQVFTTPLV